MGIIMPGTNAVTLWIVLIISAPSNIVSIYIILYHYKVDKWIKANIDSFPKFAKYIRIDHKYGRNYLETVNCYIPPLLCAEIELKTMKVALKSNLTKSDLYIDDTRYQSTDYHAVRIDNTRIAKVPYKSEAEAIVDAIKEILPDTENPKDKALISYSSFIATE